MNQYKKPSDCDFASTFIAFFTSMFFAVLLAGIVLLLITRWYVRETAKDVKAATDIYLKYRLNKNSEGKKSD